MSNTDRNCPVCKESLVENHQINRAGYGECNGRAFSATNAQLGLIAYSYIPKLLRQIYNYERVLDKDDVKASPEISNAAVNAYGSKHFLSGQRINGYEDGFNDGWSASTKYAKASKELAKASSKRR